MPLVKQCSSQWIKCLQDQANNKQMFIVSVRVAILLLMGD